MIDALVPPAIAGEMQGVIPCPQCRSAVRRQRRAAQLRRTRRTGTLYVYGPGGLVLEQISGSTTSWYHHDDVGSTRAITNSAGAKVASYTYDPYGNVNACTGTTVTINGTNKCTGTVTVSNPFMFQGQYRDNESNLYYLRARYYDSTTAQFLTVDPMVSTTRSPYAYVDDDPLNGTDPTGAWYIPNPLPIAEGDGAACAGTVEVPGVDAATCGSDIPLWIGAGVIGILDIFSSGSGSSSAQPQNGNGVATAVGGTATFAGPNGTCTNVTPSAWPNFQDPSQAPGPGWAWRGNGPPGSNQGAWYNPETGESLHPDLDHLDPIGPHYDYVAPDGTQYRIYQNGQIEQK
jgi:RHS repeat-associated protein